MLKNDQVVNWIQDFLSGRGQYVMFNQTASSIANVESGVPQGSVLGPLLFLMFINDIATNIRVNIGLYADDCILYH